jgi:hypothetical protein
MTIADTDHNSPSLNPSVEVTILWLKVVTSAVEIGAL